MHALDLDRETREALWRRVGELLEGHREGLRGCAIAPEAAAPQDFAVGDPQDPLAVVDAAFRALEGGMTHVDHPRYFGLFNPAPAALAVLADAIASGLNPQLATRSHAPWAVDAEAELIRALGERFGWSRDETGGTFTSGGGEANVTALLVALGEAFPEARSRGVRALPGEPCVYVSAEGHGTIRRAAHVAGLGTDAVREIPTDAQLRMKPERLREAVAKDRADGRLPFFIAATAGTTGSGSIDPIREIAGIAERAGCWFHVDAAWGGLAALVPELRSVVDGSAQADSLTFDPHKAMSAPMGTGALLVRREGALERTFAIRAGYMPRDGASDPYARSMQWSRRFLGLRVLMPLAAAGWEGYAASLRTQVALADRLRTGLLARRWLLVNDTPLPVVCFVDEVRRGGRFLDAVARAVLASRGGWLSVPRFSSGARALRACVNNHRTTAEDIDALLDALDRAREAT